MPQRTVGQEEENAHRPGSKEEEDEEEALVAQRAPLGRLVDVVELQDGLPIQQHCTWLTVLTSSPLGGGLRFGMRNI